MRRVVITGMGIVSPLGIGAAVAQQRLHTLENAITHSETLAEYEGLRTHLESRVRNFTRPAHWTRKTTRSMSPVSEFALVATEEALAQAGLTNDPVLQSGRTGVAYGSCSGSIDASLDFASILTEKAVRAVTSTSYIKFMSHTAAVNLSIHFGLTGRLYNTSSACTSGSQAIGYSYEAIRSGAQDVMIAGGGEEFSVTQVAVFDTLFATSRRNDAPQLTPRAFDRNRDGLVIGEGAGTLILEERDHAIARGATILAEVVGFATNTDGTHVTNPNAATQAQCMRLALADAHLTPADIGYVNAHGTATEHGDITEGTSTSEVYGPDVPVSTFKNYMGHTLGAAGALEAIFTIGCMREGWFAPNLNLETPDERCGALNLIRGEGLEKKIRYAASNKFAFGGVNTSLLFAID